MTDIPAEIIVGPPEERDELEALLQTHGGRITTELVVEAAANPTSALHSHFTWDDTEAARKFRLQQAGQLLRRFRIVRQVDQRTVRVPAFIKMPDTANGYGRTTDVVSSDWVVTQRRLRIITAIERLRDELRDWDEFTGLVEALDQVLEATSA